MKSPKKKEAQDEKSSHLKDTVACCEANKKWKYVSHIHSLTDQGMRFGERRFVSL